jgi:hypothetical protein
VVKVLGGDVAELFPAVEAASPFAAPVEGFDFGVLDDGGESVFPLWRVSTYVCWQLVFAEGFSR